MFRSNVGSMFFYFVGKVLDENSGKVSTWMQVSTWVGNILGGCLFESVLTIWCSSLLYDARAIPSV